MKVPRVTHLIAVESLGALGTVRYLVSFVMELKPRAVHIAGCGSFRAATSFGTLRGLDRPGRRDESQAGHVADAGPRLLTVKEAAAILRVCTATVYSMVERGELDHVRVSNAIRITVACLEGRGSQSGVL